MTIPKIGIAKELDSQTLEYHKIVAVFGICNNTLCIQDHALQRYISRGEEKKDNPILEKLYCSLSTSLVVERKNAAKQEGRHGEKAVYRFEDGWIFVLTWIQQFGFWLLKTVYRKEGTQLAVYDIKNNRAAIRASAWTPTLA